ncbi:MAG: hypothetical protein JWR44_2936 [Hymenobacter sp.]|nr:hypothetical protein [Hymenobacter sp.]
MNRSLSLRSAQSQTAATSSTRARLLASSPFLRALMLGVLALLGTVGSAMAQDTPSVKAKLAGSQALYLTVENPKHQRLQMQVISLVKDTFMVFEVNHLASYGAQLNFKGVPAGPYAVVLCVGRERYRYNVQVEATPQTTITVRELTPAKTPEMVASTTR